MVFFRKIVSILDKTSEVDLACESLSLLLAEKGFGNLLKSRILLFVQRTLKEVYTRDRDQFRTQVGYLMDFFRRVDKVDISNLTLLGMRDSFHSDSEWATREVSPFLIRDARSKDFLVNALVKQFGVDANRASNWVDIICSRDNLFDQKGLNFEPLYFLSDQSSVMVASEVDIVGAYDFIKNLLAPAESYIYFPPQAKEGGSISFVARHLLIFQIANLLSCEGGEMISFHYTHTHPVLDEVARFLAQGEGLDEARAQGSRFSDNDLANIERFLNRADLLTEDGICYISPNTVFTTPSGETKRLQPDARYKNYVEFRVMYRDCYEYLSDKEVTAGIRQELSALIVNCIMGRISQEKVMAFMKEHSVNEDLINKFQSKLYDGVSEEWDTFFGIQKSYREVTALERGFYPVFLSDNYVNSLIKKYSLESIPYDEALEFIVAKHSPMFMEIMRQKYGLNNLFKDLDKGLILEGKESSTARISAIVDDMLQVKGRFSLLGRDISDGARTDAIAAFKELWKATTPVSARQAERNIDAVFARHYKEGSLYRIP